MFASIAVVVVVVAVVVFSKVSKLLRSVLHLLKQSWLAKLGVWTLASEIWNLDLGMLVFLTVLMCVVFEGAVLQLAMFDVCMAVGLMQNVGLVQNSFPCVGMRLNAMMMGPVGLRLSGSTVALVLGVVVVVVAVKVEVDLSGLYSWVANAS